jgi:hypothetical protein
VNWTAPGTFQINVTVSNACSSFPVIRNEVITVLCVPVYSNAVPADIRCGSDPAVLLDPCNQYQKQIESCTNNIQWVFHSNNTACGGCTTTFFNNTAFSDSSTINYFKSCAVNCTANAIPYTASSTVNIGTVSGSSQAQANANAQNQATANVVADQAANGQNNANNTPDNIACSCTTTFSSTQTRNECGIFTRNNCASGCTGATATICRDGTETRTSTVSQGDADNLAIAAASVTAMNNVNNDGQSAANSAATCNCSCNWVNINSTYCVGNDVMQDQEDGCGNNRTIVAQANGANIWTMTGNTTCVGSDLINEEVNGCGTNRYINVNTANHPSCAPDPCTVCNNLSNIGINGPTVAQLNTPVTFHAVIDIPECATYDIGCGPCAYIHNVPNDSLTIQYNSTFMIVGDTSEVVLTVAKPGCPLQTVSRTITIVA